MLYQSNKVEEQDLSEATIWPIENSSYSKLYPSGNIGLSESSYRLSTASPVSSDHSSDHWSTSTGSVGVGQTPFYDDLVIPNCPVTSTGSNRLTNSASSSSSSSSSNSQPRTASKSRKHKSDNTHTVTPSKRRREGKLS